MTLRVIQWATGPVGMAATRDGGTRVYRARIYYRGRYVASRTFQRKRAAQEWERRQVESLRSGVWSDPAAGDRRVREWCEIWLNAQPARQPATVRKIRRVIAKQIADTSSRSRACWVMNRRRPRSITTRVFFRRTLTTSLPVLTAD
jgi:hypothetical protein